MKYIIQLFILTTLISCSKNNGVSYLNLPCTDEINSYITVINNEYKKSLAIDYKKDLKEFIESSSKEIKPYKNIFSDCVWQTHEENSEDYSDKDRNTVLLFSDSYRDISGTFTTIIEENEFNEVDYKFIKYVLKTEKNILNKHRQATQKETQ